ncbi:hypothetical protein L6164_013070 [Bauhinia variegata]|uniref:Uncharacterized protein n=1 Tax=Bauhinia variegata TaxID=167791 RepID=A0ACB9PCA9_BAUVA|nr:hypothetical protein L6164_013070 [Bauhinia variegata]
MIKYFEKLSPQKKKPDGVNVWHFTDLLRRFYLSSSQRLQVRSPVNVILEHLHSASELIEAGVEFKADEENKCLLELQYVKGVLTMPRLDVSDTTEIHLRNIVAFEQAHYPHDTYITDYLKVLVAHDLILLENQLPYFVLDGLYNLATKSDPSFPSFLEFSFKYFEKFNPQEIKPEGVNIWHFTDLLRRFYLSSSQRLQERSQVNVILEHLYSASELIEAGVEFKADEENKCLLELQYVKGVLTMPRLDVSDTTEIHLRNIVAFEQAHYPRDTYITDYLKVLDFLINSERDVDILIHKGIITTLLGDSNEVATMINRLCSNLIQPNMNNEYLSICQLLNKFYEKPMNKWKADLIHDYFDTPVKTATSIAAIILIVLTFVQTVCSIYPLVQGS